MFTYTGDGSHTLSFSITSAFRTFKEDIQLIISSQWLWRLHTSCSYFISVFRTFKEDMQLLISSQWLWRLHTSYCYITSVSGHFSAECFIFQPLFPPKLQIYLDSWVSKSFLHKKKFQRNELYIDYCLNWQKRLDFWVYKLFLHKKQNK